MEGKGYFDGSFLEKFWKENLEYIKSEVDLNYQKVEKFWKENLEYIKCEVDFELPKSGKILERKPGIYQKRGRFELPKSVSNFWKNGDSLRCV